MFERRRRLNTPTMIQALRTTALSAVLSLTCLWAQTPNTVALPCDRDTTIYNNLAQSSNGQGVTLHVGWNIQCQEMRALLHFPILHAIPPGSIVTQAELRLTAAAAGTGICLEAHRLLADWGEAFSAAAPPLGSFGASAQAGDATWSRASTPLNQWINLGGDFVPTASAQGRASGPFGTTWTFSGQGLVADVQSWVDNPQQNFGLLVKACPSPTTCIQGVSIVSRDECLYGYSPTLIINYVTATGFEATAHPFGRGTRAIASTLRGLIELKALSRPILGLQTFAMEISQADPGVQAWIYPSLSEAATPVVYSNTCNLLFIDLSSYLSIAALGLAPWGPFTLDSNGEYVLPIPLALVPELLNAKIVLQAAISTLGQLSSSNALVLRLGI